MSSAPFFSYKFQCIRVPLPASKGYFRGSTGKSNQAQASQIALNKFEELYFKVKSGGTLQDKSYKDLLNVWSKDPIN
ncbi:hypothetical protein OAM78_05940 [Alphaproteobacteria bacterium]|nr:hypothetical protein [Alphaproteobacteria bacterium]